MRTVAVKIEPVLFTKAEYKVLEKACQTCQTYAEFNAREQKILRVVTQQIRKKSSRLGN